MKTLTKSITILEDGKLSVFLTGGNSTGEKIYLQPPIVVDTLDANSLLTVRDKNNDTCTVNNDIKEINGVPFDSGNFKELETEIRSLAREANSVNNTKTHGKKFSISTDFVLHEFPTAQTEYLVYSIKVKEGVGKVRIKGVSVSVQSDSNDDFQLKSSINKKFTYTILDSDYSDISPESKLELAQPNVQAVPTNPNKPTANGFLTGGRNIKAKFGVKETVIELVDTSPIELVEGMTYDITAMGRSGSAKLDIALNWEEC
jgi:hypothetical protein